MTQSHLLLVIPAFQQTHLGQIGRSCHPNWTRKLGCFKVRPMHSGSAKTQSASGAGPLRKQHDAKGKFGSLSKYSRVSKRLGSLHSGNVETTSSSPCHHLHGPPSVLRKPSGPPATRANVPTNEANPKLSRKRQHFWSEEVQE